MDKKLFILLFAVVFYNGVAYSSPLDEKQISDPKPLEEKHEPVADHINKEITATVTPAVQPTPISQNSSALAPSQVPDLKNETVVPAAVSTTTSVPQPVSLTNVTQDNIKNATQVVVDNKNATQTTEVKNSSVPVVDMRNSSQPAAHVPVSTDSAPTGKAITEMPRPTTPVQTTTASPTMATPVSKNETQTTTKASAATKPAAVTQSPTPKESVVIENNVPAPAEKHFDGPSFIGGIVLTIGLTAIGFIAFKYYKSGKIDMSYRTL